MKLLAMHKKLAMTLALTMTLVACDSMTGQEKAMAKVGDKVIGQDDFAAFLKIKRVNTDDVETVEKYRKEFLKREALSQAIVASPRLDQAQFEAELNEIRKDLAMSQYFEKFLAEAASDQAIANYYQTNIENYTSKKAQVSHILLRVKNNASEQEQQAVLTKAHEVVSELKTGKSFTEMVEAYSEDAVSKKKGGSLGWVSQGAVAPAFSEQVFEKAEEGQPSAPVLTQFGYHIILVNDGPAKVTLPLEKVKGDIRYQLRKIAKEQELARLQDQVEVRIYSER